jgi:hypothetical protein
MIFKEFLHIQTYYFVWTTSYDTCLEASFQAESKIENRFLKFSLQKKLYIFEYGAHYANIGDFLPFTIFKEVLLIQIYFFCWNKSWDTCLEASIQAESRIENSFLKFSLRKKLYVFEYGTLQANVGNVPPFMIFKEFFVLYRG